VGTEEIEIPWSQKLNKHHSVITLHAAAEGKEIKPVKRFA
jgi:hypothetical protein